MDGKLGFAVIYWCEEGLPTAPKWSTWYGKCPESHTVEAFVITSSTLRMLCSHSPFFVFRPRSHEKSNHEGGLFWIVGGAHAYLLLLLKSSVSGGGGVT